LRALGAVKTRDRIEQANQANLNQVIDFDTRGQARHIDYVHHFCGLDCLEKWHEQAKK
jgi:hypothetical protein